MTDNRADSPEAIEREIDQTQDNIGETVEKLEDRMSPRKLAQSLFSDENADNGREAWQVVRESPLPVALIAAGAIWLVATSRAPMISRLRDEMRARIKGAVGSGRSQGALRRRSDEPAPIGPPPETGGAYDRRQEEIAGI